MDSILHHPWHDLDLAETELSSHCARLGPDDAPEKCWQAYSFLERKREQAKVACDRGDAAECAELERLNDMAHQLLSTGSVEDLVATFASLAHVEETRATRAAQQQQQQASPAAQQVAAGGAAAGQGSPGSGPASSTAAAAPDPVHVLFCKLDSDGDGRLTLAELRQGMKLLGEELDGQTVSVICEALDLVHSSGTNELEGTSLVGIDEQQFRDILDAQRLNSHSQVAQMWRRGARHAQRTDWWSG